MNYPSYIKEYLNSIAPQIKALKNIVFKQIYIKDRKKYHKNEMFPHYMKELQNLINNNSFGAQIGFKWSKQNFIDKEHAYFWIRTGELSITVDRGFIRDRAYINYSNNNKLNKIMLYPSVKPKILSEQSIVLVSSLLEEVINHLRFKRSILQEEDFNPSTQPVSLLEFADPSSRRLASYNILNSSLSVKSSKQENKVKI